MGLKEYLKQKKEAFEKFKKSRAIERERHIDELDRDLAKRAKSARMEIKRIRKREKSTRTIERYNRLKSKGRLGYGGMGSYFGDVAGFNSPEPKPMKKSPTPDMFGGGNIFGSFGNSNNMFGSGDMLGGDLFGSSRRKKKKSGKRTITMRVI